MRGLSDAYGSWKIICMRRRSGRIADWLAWVMSVPAKTILPAVGSCSRVTSRASVDLPQPDSPTSPTVSPRHDLQVDAIDGAQHALAREEGLLRAAGNASAGPRPRESAPAGGGSTRRGDPALGRVRGVCSEPPCLRHPAPRGSRRGRSTGSSSGCSAHFSIGKGAARAKAAAGRPGARVRRLALDGDQPAILGLRHRSAARRAAAPRYRDGADRSADPRARLPRPPRRHTSPARASRYWRSRRGRG